MCRGREGVMGMRVRQWMFVVVLAVFALPLAARTKLEGYVEQGGQRHLNSGIFSITRSGSTQTNPYSMQSYPNASVTVFVTGTLTTATLYADTSGTPKSNPFTASSNAYWSFYIDDGTYDIRFSGGGITTPFTRTGITTGTSGLTLSILGFGAVCDNLTDDTAAIQAAYSFVGPHTVEWPAATCRTTDTITISQDRVNTQGAGQQASILNFVPTSGPKGAVHFTTGVDSVLYQNSIRDIAIKSSNTSLVKYGIEATDTSMLLIENVAIGPTGQFTGGSSISPFTGGGSVAIKLNGREATAIRRVSLAADIPLWIDDNPNDTIDVDHLHVEDFYGVASGTNPIVYISSGVNLSDVTFDGYQVWAVGARGLYWVDTTSVFSSHNLRIDNVRYEQATARQYVFDIEHNTALFDASFNNIVFGAGTQSDGFKLRKVQHPKFDTYTYNGTGVALNVDSTVVSVILDRVFFQDNSTLSMGTLQRIEERGRTNGLSPSGRTEFWMDPANVFLSVGTARVFMDEEQWASQGTLADGATTPIPSQGGAINHGRVSIRYKGATKRGSFTAYFDSVGAYIESTTDTSKGTTETGIGNLPGRITVLWGSAASVQLFNNLGESVQYSIVISQSD